MAYIVLNGGSSSQVTAYVTGLDTAYSKADRVGAWYVDGSPRGSVNIGANALFTESITLSGIGADTPYEVTCVITAESWSYSVTVNIVQWTWTMSNGPWSTMNQAKNAYTALTTKGNTSSFTYEVWNDLVKKADDLLTYQKLSWVSTYAGYYSTLMSSTSKELTAVRYNSLVCQVNTLINNAGFGGINLAYVSKGNAVMGSYFTTLATRINQCMT